MNILFDLDGTLTDPRAGILVCFKFALGELGRSIPSDTALERYIGPPLRESFASLLGTTDEAQVAAAVALYRQRFSMKGMFENEVYTGIPDALIELRRIGAALYVVTSKPHMFAEQILKHFGLRAYFQSVYGSGMNGTRSDKADLIGHVLASESLSADSTLMVGDRSHDVLGARANDVFPIGALWRYGSGEELTAAGATILCKQPNLLVAALSAARV